MASGSTEQSETDTTETLVTKRNSTLVVWNYFGFKKDDAAQCQVLCRACRATVATSRGNTTNLFQHLKYYKTMYDSCMAKMPSTSAPDKYLSSAAVWLKYVREGILLGFLTVRTQSQTKVQTNTCRIISFKNRTKRDPKRQKTQKSKKTKVQYHTRLTELEKCRILA